MFFSPKKHLDIPRMQTSALPSGSHRRPAGEAEAGSGDAGRRWNQLNYRLGWPIWFEARCSFQRS